MPIRDRGLSFSSFESLIAMAAAGVGPAILPSYAMSSGANDQIVAVRLRAPVLAMEFHMISRHGREQPSVIEPFTAAVLQQWHQGGSLDATIIAQ